jgi:glycosyltransferase involved in cell wall biosynthesis
VDARARAGGRAISALLTRPRAAAPPQPRVLLVAPFARGRSHGGSLRATAMAERLEDRGAAVTWLTVPVEHGTRREKLSSLLRGEPALVRAHTRALPELTGSWDTVIASHSYLAPVLDAAPAGARRVVDFHNLEWRVLAGTARAEGGAHGAYLRVQSQLMRRFERATLDTPGVVAALATTGEAAWAAGADALVIPNVLPRAAVAEARATAHRARERAPGGPLLYLGTLTFPPNVRALLSFLNEAWPAVRAAHHDATLLIAGRCSAETRALLDRHPGVRTLGFVDDLPGLLAGAAAALLPFDGQGGSSLRCLQYALAGIPVVASAAGARGLPFTPGLLAESPAEWSRAIAAVRASTDELATAVAHARAGAREIQSDETPWNALWSRLAVAA